MPHSPDYSMWTPEQLAIEQRQDAEQIKILRDYLATAGAEPAPERARAAAGGR